MDVGTAQRLVGEEGRAALARAAELGDPSSLSAATALRKEVDADLAAAVLEQLTLRRRAEAKLGERAHDLYLTRAGLEQATRPRVAALRARSMWADGIRRAVDLTTGLGLDLLAMQDAGIEVRGVELDPVVTILANANLSSAAGHADAPTGPDPGRVENADATTVTVDPEETAFLDPARRTARGRTWQVADFTPPWEFVLDQLANGAWAKLGPGMPHDLIPDRCAADWISDEGDLVEVQLRPGPEGSRLDPVGPSDPVGRPDSVARPDAVASRPERTAVLLRGDDVIRVPASDHPPEPRPLGQYIAEPDPALTRAGAAGTLAADHDLGAVAEGIAYLTADQPAAHPGLTWFRILEVLPFREKTLKAWVRDHGIGTLEIKKRGIDVDPAALRKRLRPKGDAAATLILTPTATQTVVLVVERTPGGLVA